MSNSYFYRKLIQATTDMIQDIIERQREFFHSGKTLDIEYRIAALKRLRKAIIRMEPEIGAALKEDLGKSATESYMCETGMALSGLSYAIRHIPEWSRRRRACSPLAQFPARSYIIPEPYGNVLIMSPWNYPFLLCISPLVSAIAAGNTAIIKPSAYSPATSRIIVSLVSEAFDPGHVDVVEGGRDVNSGLLEQKFDYIFFTGSKTVGRLVMSKAAVHLTPVTLELGGKSPVIVDSSADLRVSARRIVFGKFLNCGQTCVAPDYVLADSRIIDKFMEMCKEEALLMYGFDALANEDYGHIINRKHFDRLSGLLAGCRLAGNGQNGHDGICFGGRTDPGRLKIEPTIIRLSHELITGSERHRVHDGNCRHEGLDRNGCCSDRTGTGTGNDGNPGTPTIGAATDNSGIRSEASGNPGSVILGREGQEAIMSEEIFGPLLPVIPYSDINDAVEYICRNPRPLAAYIFTGDKRFKEDMLRRLHFGGGCVNDTIIHLATEEMPFGGIGESGMGRYHGRYGFETFSHLKSIVDKPTWLDLPMRYQPFTSLKDRLIRTFLK